MSEQPKQAPWWQPGLLLFLKLSSWIAGPILAAVFLGKFLDRQFDTEPWIFLSLTALAFLFSTFAIVFIYIKEMKKIEDKDKEATKSRQDSSGQENNDKEEK